MSAHRPYPYHHANAAHGFIVDDEHDDEPSAPRTIETGGYRHESPEDAPTSAVVPTLSTDEFLDRFASQASEFLRNAYYLSHRPLRRTVSSPSPSSSSSSFLTTSLCEDVEFGVSAQLAVLDGYLASLLEDRRCDEEDTTPVDEDEEEKDNIRTDAVYSLLHAMYCKQIAYRDRLLFPLPGRSDGRDDGREGPDGLGGKEDDQDDGDVNDEGENGDKNYDEELQEDEEEVEEDWERCLAAANDFYRLMERTEEIFGGGSGSISCLFSPGPSTASMRATDDLLGVTREDVGRVGGDGDDGHGEGIEESTSTTSSSTQPPLTPAPSPIHAPTSPELSGLLQLYATDAVHAARLVSVSYVRTMERSSIVNDLFGPRWETTLTGNEVALSIVRTAEDYLADVEECSCNEFLLRKVTESTIESTVAFYVTCLVRRVESIRRARRARKKRVAKARRAVAAGRERAASAASAAATTLKASRGKSGGAATSSPTHQTTTGGSPHSAAEGGGGGMSDHHHPPRPFVDPVAASRRMGDDVYLMKSSFKKWAILTMPVLDGIIEREFGALEAACSCLRAAAGVSDAPRRPDDDDGNDDLSASASAATRGVPADFVSTLHEGTGGDVTVTRRFICDLWYLAVPDEGEYWTLPVSVEDELRKCEDQGGSGQRRAVKHPRDRVDRGITLESALADAYCGEEGSEAVKGSHRLFGLPGTGTGTGGAGKENSALGGGGSRGPAGRVKLPDAAREVGSYTRRKLSKVHVPRNVSRAGVKKTASSFVRTCKRAGHLQKT